MKRIISILILSVFCLKIANAQYFQTGQDPSQIKWRQINTSNFQVIYPQEFEKQAQRISYILEKVYDYADYSLKFHPRKVSVILHTRTVNSNGLLAWAPKRIELFTTPNQQIYAQDWLEQLALHEFRHLVQMDKIQSELPVLVKILLGEQAAAAVTGIYLPLWFLEGDAVVTETSLSNSGRGRTASFSMEHRAQLLEKGKYSFDKAYLGSYKDFVPDYYQLGYWLVAKNREKFGADIWPNALQRIGHHPFSITPFNSSLKTTTGSSAKQLYSGTFDELTQEWEKSLSSRVIDSFTIVSPAKKAYTNYLYPEVYHDSIIFAYRASINDIGRFVLIYPDKREQVIYTPGSIFEESVSKTGSLVIWAERRADLRWTHSDRSVIQVLDIDSRKHYEIKPEHKLFSPTISPDLKSFAAVEIDEENNFFLSVFDLKSGARKFQYKTTDNQYFFTPAWDNEVRQLFFIGLSSQGKCLASVDLQTRHFKKLTDATFANLRNPVNCSNRIIFSADFAGTDNLYTLDLNSGKITQTASVPFGADYPTYSKTANKLYFCNYTSNGYQIARTELESTNRNEPINSIQLQTNHLADKLASQEKGIPNFATSDTTFFASKKYSKLGHLFNFHSWAPAYIDINSYEVKPGVSFFSQNKLGTAETSLGYEYNTNDKVGKYKLSFKYLGWFPEITTELSVGNEATNYYLITNILNQQNQIIRQDTTIERLTWKEITADVNLRLPFNFSKGKYLRIFYPEIEYAMTSTSKPDSALKNLYPGNYQALSYRIYGYNLLRQSGQNIMPRWGQVLDVIYRNTPLGQTDLGTLAGVQTVLYIPGFAKNDGFRIYQGFQNKSFSNSQNNFANFIRSPRGFYSYQNNKMYSLSIDYKFPICYPDFSVGKLAYIKRIKSTVFYDYGWISAPTRNKDGVIYPNSLKMDMKSVGVELMSDLHFLRFFAPMELGVRSIYRPDYQDFQFNVLFSVDFNGF